MSKREGQPGNSANAPEAKKPKILKGILKTPSPPGYFTPEQRPNTPIAGPSTASSDPDLQVMVHTGLIPICRYFDHAHTQDNSSQSSSAVDVVPSSSTVTTSSTNAEFGDSRTSSVQNMDMDSDTTTTESSTSVDQNDQNDQKRSHSDQ